MSLRTETCYTCEYKRLAREAIVALRSCIGFLDMGVKRKWMGMAEELRDRFLSLMRQEAKDKV